MDKILQIYQDDIIVFSRDRNNHIRHLKQVFERCRKYRTPLNPKKSVFGVDEGKLLRHIILKDGVKVDAKRIEAIEQVPLPTNKKEV